MATPGIVQKILIDGHEADYVGSISKSQIHDLDSAQLPRWTAYVSPNHNNTYPYYSSIPAAINAISAKMTTDGAGANDRGLVEIYPGVYGDFLAANNIDMFAHAGSKINKCDMNNVSITFTCKGYLTYLVGVGTNFVIDANEIGYVQATQLTYCSITAREASVINLNGNLASSQINITGSQVGTVISITTLSANAVLGISANRISDLSITSPITTKTLVYAQSIGTAGVRNGACFVSTLNAGAVNLTGTARFAIFGAIVESSGDCVKIIEEVSFAATGCWIRSASGYCLNITAASRVSLSDTVLIATTTTIYSNAANYPVKIYGGTCANVGVVNCTFSPNALLIDPSVMWWV